METTEIILREDGALLERIVRERELDAGPKFMEALTQGLFRRLRHVFSIPDWGVVHASVGASNTLWTIALTQLPLHARFHLAQGILVPAFGSSSQVELPLVWVPPDELRLALVIQTEPDGQWVSLGGNWLFAFDQDQRGYRLPLPNLHDDCQICTGSFAKRHDTGVEAVQASLEQFRKSKWNADLMRTVEQSQKFFRFRPTEESFETLPIDAADWTTLCDKVSTDLMERVIL